MSFIPYEVHQMEYSLDFLTDVQRTYDEEKRVQLRSEAQIAASFTARLVGSEIREFSDLIEESNGEITVPDWRFPLWVPGDGTTTFEIDPQGLTLRVGDEVALAKGKRVILTSVLDVQGAIVTVAFNDMRNFYLMKTLRLKLLEEPKITPRGGATADASFSGVHDVYEEADAVSMTARIYITMDYSGSMTATRLSTQREAVKSLLAKLRNSDFTGDVKLVLFSSASGPSIERFEITVEGFDDLLAWMDTATHSGGTSFSAAVSEAPSFFADTPEDRDKIIILITDGEAGDSASARSTLDTIPDNRTYCFNIESGNIFQLQVIDNTPNDGVPVVSEENVVGLYTSLTAAVEGSDLNFMNGYLVGSDRDIFGSPDSSVYVAESPFLGDVGPVTMVPVQERTSRFSTVSGASKTPKQAISRNKFFTQLAGRLRPFYKPSWFPDFELTEDAPSGSSVLSVVSTGLTDSLGIAIQTKTGQTSFHTVNSRTATSFSVSPALVFDVTSENVSTISRMEFHRLDTDSVKFRYSEPYSVEFNVPTRRVKE